MDRDTWPAELRGEARSGGAVKWWYEYRIVHMNSLFLVAYEVPAQPYRAWVRVSPDQATVQKALRWLVEGGTSTP